MLRSSLLAGIAGMVLLAGCSFNVGSSLGLSSQDRLAQAVGDEPYAVKAGAAVLAQGGNAADAAAAMYFTLAASYPVAGGLSAGGVCLLRDPDKGTSEEFAFLPTADGSDAPVTAGVRAIAAMQSAYGALPWQKVVSPAESYARAGVPMTKALSARLAAVDKVKLDPVLVAQFFDGKGNVKPVGAVLSNPELADTLAAIRMDGPQTVYTGRVAQAVLSYLSGKGVSAADLAALQPVRRTPRVSEAGGNYVYLSSDKVGSAFARALIAAVARQKGIDAKGLQTAVTDVATKLSLASSDTGATGFAVTDRSGRAVACALTMGAPFGSGHVIKGTGIVVAAPNASANAYLTPVLASSSSDGPTILAGAAAGGPSGVGVLADGLIRLGRDEPPAKRTDLTKVAGQPYDQGNLIVCNSDVCTALPDPAASGLGLTLQPQGKAK